MFIPALYQLVLIDSFVNCSATSNYPKFRSIVIENQRIVPLLDEDRILRSLGGCNIIFRLDDLVNFSSDW